jgi:deoxyribodipyrimidine photo-lyase
MSFAVHWFRRDLRIDGNPALSKALDSFDGKVVGLFCFDKAFLSREDFSHNRFHFFIQTLKALKSDLNSLGGDLLVLNTGPVESWERLFRTGKGNKCPCRVL